MFLGPNFLSIFKEDDVLLSSRHHVVSGDHFLE